MDQTSAIIEWNSNISNIYDNYIFIFWGQTYMIIIFPWSMYEICNVKHGHCQGAIALFPLLQNI